MFPKKWNIRYTKNSLKVDSTWKKKQRAAKGDMTEISREIDKKSGINLGHCAADVSRQAEMKILGKGLVCSWQEED